jgi:DNA-binding transcriptional LysR family regulator
LLAGLGIGLLPDFSIPQAAGKQPPLVQVLPDWQVQGFFGERIYALRPWSPQVPKAVTYFVDHLRQDFGLGFGPTALNPQG